MTQNERDTINSEQLVQRFIDQELSAEERVRFISRLGRDEALRQRTIELEQLVLDASRLPRPAVPDDFVARVMAHAEPPAPAKSGWWHALAATLWAPRELRWNLAGAIAAACLAFAVLGGVASGRLALNPVQSPAPTTATPTASTAAGSTVLVRLVVLQPTARTVQVAGDFNGWNPVSTSLKQTSNGAWAATIPLKPGRYEYMLVVDGQWIADPFAAEQSDDGFGSRNAVLDVRPPVGA